jgi:hypothetical protein
LKRLLADARLWCREVRGRQSELAALLGVSRNAVSAWFAVDPKKHPTVEQGRVSGGTATREKAASRSSRPKRLTK